MSTTPIGAGSRVTLHLAITLEDGTVADSTFEDEPLTFTLGDDTLAAGLEQMLVGMRAGEESLLLISPEEGYGLRDEEQVHQVPRATFPAEMVLEVGQIIAFSTPAGHELAGSVRALEGEEVTMDFNHPLAGHHLAVRVAILAVEPPVPEDSP